MTPKVSVLWALIPLLTVGMGTMFVLGWAANRLKSRWLAISAGAALIATVLVFVLGNSPQGSAGASAAGGLLLVGLMGGGLAATFGIRRRLVGPGRSDDLSAYAAGWGAASSWGSQSGSVDPAIGEALEHRRRRLEARHLLERDPALARELGIGRPDLPRRFDDGGLVDVNHVPAAVLAGLPGFTPELAERVTRVRAEHDGFDYAAEMGIYADLPEEFTEELAERLVFLR